MYLLLLYATVLPAPILCTVLRGSGFDDVTFESTLYIRGKPFTSSPTAPLALFPQDRWNPDQCNWTATTGPMMNGEWHVL